MIDHMTKYQGRGTLQITGRGTGKSMMAHAYQAFMQAMAGHLAGKETYKLIVERSEGRVFGARYWTVHPVIEPAWNTEPKAWNEMMAWMVETFGPTAKDGVFTPGQRWYVNNAKFWFRNEQDLLLFLLRWQ